MIFTLHRYIFKELFKNFILATFAMTMILTLGFLLKPIKDYGVSPVQIIHLLGYCLPITLTFVMPMGALFAASMVYGRFASDRELDACRASGISMWTLVYPGLCLSILVAVVNLILSFHVTPAFIHRSEKSVKANAEQILFRNLQRKGNYTLPKSSYIIYAEKTSPEKKLLEGVIIIDTRRPDIQRMTTAARAKVDIQTFSNYNQVKITALNAYRVDDISPVYFEELVVSSQFESLLADKIKFQKLDKLKSIRADKMNFFPVRQTALKLYAQLVTEMTGEFLNGVFQEVQPQIHLDDSEGIRSYILTASACKVDPKREKTLELVPPIRLIEMDAIRNQRICQYESSVGFCRINTDQDNLVLELDIENPTWDRGGGIHGVTSRVYVNTIQIPRAVRLKFNQKPVLSLLAKIGQDNSLINKPSPKLVADIHILNEKIDKVNKEIDSELHSRLVLGLGCIPLILTGIALGIVFRGGHLLSAFGASAIPAGLLVIFIVAGKQLTTNPASSAFLGILFIWGGIIMLMIVTFMLYRHLLKT